MHIYQLMFYNDMQNFDMYFHIYFQNLVFSYIFSELNILIYIVKA